MPISFIREYINRIVAAYEMSWIFIQIPRRQVLYRVIFINLRYIKKPRGVKNIHGKDMVSAARRNQSQRTCGWIILHTKEGKTFLRSITHIYDRYGKPEYYVVLQLQGLSANFLSKHRPFLKLLDIYIHVRPMFIKKDTPGFILRSSWSGSNAHYI